MTEKQYKWLCKHYDKLLAGKIDLSRISIPLINVIREHPNFLQKYYILFDANFLFFLYLVNRRIKNFVWWCYFILKVSIKKRFNDLNKPEKVDYLFVSHLINEKHFASDIDFYYGDLLIQLVNRGYKVAVLLIRHTPKTKKSLKSFHKNNITYYFVQHSLDLSRELLVHKELKKESRIVKSLKDVPLRLNQLASVDALSSGAHFNFRFSYQLTSMLRMLTPKVLVTTYEGHSWEKIAFYSARKLKKDIFCIGYQHAALFKLQHGVRTLDDSRYNPDLILSSGKASERQLLNRSDIRVSVGVLGSYRSQLNLDRHTKSFHPHIKICLVIPEGTISESDYLFNFALNCALQFSDVKFILRLHPVIDFRDLSRRNKKLKKLPSNVTLSSRPIEDDAREATIVLYRGSTAVVQACSFGAMPVYLENIGEISIDPFYDFNLVKIKIRSVKDFANILRSDNTPSISQKKHLIEYCRSFFTALDPDVIDIKNIPLKK
jgi:hypothetical protein